MANSAATIGTPTVSSVTEDANSPFLTAIGVISISDPNPGQAAFKTTVISAAGNLGTLTINANGAYTYKVADGAVQYLGAGDTKIDTFTVTSVDGTTKKVSFTINGANDAAVIGNPTVVNVTEDATKPFLTASGSISISDVDQGEAAFKTSVISAAGTLGKLTLQANGTYTYSVADSAVQYLGANDTKAETFTVTSVDGTTKQVTFYIHGSNDAAVIGTPTVHDVTEDATQPTLTASGTISISDADQGQSSFQTSVGSAAGNLGNLTILANGSYTYSVDNSAVQYLGAGATKVDTFTVTSFDGTTKQVSFTIHGTNDAAVIGTPTVADVTEDATKPILFATGSISISDSDGQALFKTQVISAAGNLGKLTLQANGSYTYSVADGAVQYLGANDTKVDTFTVTAIDGTAKQVSFTIHGVNDVAVIGTPTVHDVTEDSSPTTLTATGSISISDADQGQSSFQATVVSAGGNLGTLILAANGGYTYSVADSAVQYLGANATKVDTFTVTSLDGSASRVVSFTIHGVNDAAVIGTPTVQDVTADPTKTTLTATGSISITDADQGQGSFKTTVVSASGNLGTLTLAANGTYSYSVAESKAEQLGTNETKVDIFTVTSLDGTTKQVTFTVHGPGAVNNQPATIGDPTVHNVTEDSSVDTSGNLTAVGTISISDPDAGQATFQTTTTSAAGNLGSLALDASGNYTYTVANSAVQYLGATDTKIDTFTITSADGTTKQVSFTIQGVNDAAVITGTSTVNLSETDAALNTGGTLVATDVDSSNAFVVQSNVTGSGGYGQFSIGASGAWTYIATSAHNEFSAGTTYTDTLTVKTADGTSQVLTVNIAGTNDAAVITGTSTVNLSETDAVLSTGGTLVANDVDSSNAFVVQNNVTGSGGYGQFSIGANGAWTYTTTSAHNEFSAGTTYTDTLTVKTADGTSQVLTVNIAGTNDAAVITGTSTVNLSETDAALTTGGTLVANDVDSSNAFVVQNNVTGSGGYGQFSIGANGAWTYATTTAHNEFVAGTTYTDTLTVKTADGTSQVLTVNIAGTNDAAVIGQPSVANVTEDVGPDNSGNLTASGSVSITDVDSTAAFHSGATGVAGNLGSLVFGADGTYTYTVANSAVQYLGPSDTKIDTFTVTSVDGTTQQLSFNIHGAIVPVFVNVPALLDRPPFRLPALLPVPELVTSPEVSGLNDIGCQFLPPIRFGQISFAST